MSNVKIGLIQLTSKLDPVPNLNFIREGLEKCRDEACQWVFLPECFYSLSNGKEISPYLVEEGNDHYKAIQSLAKDYGMKLLGGSAATVDPTKLGKALNRIYNFDEKGQALIAYDKINLFACDLSKHASQKIINEGEIYSAGKVPQVLDLDDWKIGLGVCFDVRFPELGRYYSSLGANILTYSSAFTVPTGKAHWHTLLRARAIENQCYVIACAQYGVHNERITTYGHSLVVDPWGDILVDAKEGEKVVFADIDKARVDSVRERLNVIRAKPFYI